MYLESLQQSKLDRPNKDSTTLLHVGGKINQGLPGRSLSSHVTGMLVKRVGFVNRITVKAKEANIGPLGLG